MTEIVVVETSTSGGSSYIPPRLTGIKLGDVLVYRTKEEIETEARAGQIRGGWNQDGLMDYIFEVNPPIEFTIDDEMMQRINEKSQYITMLPTDSFSWQVSLDMLRFKNVAPVVGPDPTVKCEDLSLPKLASAKRKDIIKEMIEKVDVERFKQLIRIGSGGANIEKSVIDETLLKWAEAKYEFYLMFGRELTISTEVEAEASEQEIKFRIEEELYMKFPKYVSVLARFDQREFIENKILKNDDLFTKYLSDIYTNGKKLTKFLSDYIGDQTFNDALANVLGNRKIKASVTISIDPYDYLTMSVNNYGWVSCQRLTHEQSTGTLSLMLDECTLISYKWSGADANHCINKYKFTGNNKSWRQLVYVDKNTSSAIFGRQYPSKSDVLADTVRKELYEKTVGKYLGVEDVWKLTKRTNTAGYTKGSDKTYHDIYSKEDFYRIAHKNLDPKNKDSFVVGKNYTCLKCGGSLSTGHSFVCGRQ